MVQLTTKGDTFTPKSNLFFMKTNFIGSHKTIEEHCTVIFQ